MDDPIVREVREARRQTLASCAGDLDLWLDQLQAAEAGHTDRVVTRAQLRERTAPTMPTSDAA